MVMSKIKQPITLLVVCIPFFGIFAQKLTLKKGIIIDSLKVRESLPETYALYLPKDFELKERWPLLAVFSMEGNGKNEVTKFITMAERFGYVIAGSNAIHDSLSLSENLLRTKAMLDHVVNSLPINRSRTYTAGFTDGGRFANLVPILLKNVAGTLSINAAIVNVALLNGKKPFQFIGIADKTNFNYPILLKDEKILNNFKFPNSILSDNWSPEALSDRMLQAFSYFELLSMSKGSVPKDTVFINDRFQSDVAYIDELLKAKRYIEAYNAMGETIEAFRVLKNVDTLREQQRNLKRNKSFRTQKREEDAAFFKEALLREDFALYLEEDVLTYNYNNLGWWNYQKNQLNRYMKGDNSAEQKMGHRLIGYLNALIDDNIDLVNNQKVIDEEALVFLYMLKTIIIPDNFENYFTVASIASKNEDYGTALFYLEEAIKNGLKSAKRLYKIPHTALLRITPEFNALVEKYFKEARYKVNDR